jgi:hypothetical protein
MAAVLLPVLAGPAAAAERLPLDRTQSDHFGPAVVEPLPPPPTPDHVLRVTDRLAYRLPDPIGQWATLDKKLSHLCERGAFRQEQELALFASAGGATYGVALAEGANLHDPQKLARPGMAYFFAQPESTHCMVLSARQSRLARFGTIRLTAQPQ